MPDFSKPYSKAYDTIRQVRLNLADSLTMLNDDGQEVITVTSGWLPREIKQEQTGARVIELQVIDRDNYAEIFQQATFFEFGGVRYERTGFPNPPIGNPREWVWQLKPVGKAE